MVFVNSDQVGYECDFLAAINVRKNLVFGDLFYYHELADVFSAFSRSFEILSGIVINVCCNDIPDCQEGFSNNHFYFENYYWLFHRLLVILLNFITIMIFFCRCKVTDFFDFQQIWC